MGIFSLFGKKDREQSSPAGKIPSRPKREAQSSAFQGSVSPRKPAEKSGTRSQHTKRDAQVALATALKIDAIESEMSSEFVSTTPPHSGGNTIPGNAATSAASDTRPAQIKTTSKAGTKPTAPTPAAGDTLAPALPDMGTTTQFLLEGLSTLSEVENPTPQVAPVVEEAAIMFANGQNALVEQLLLGAIAEDNLGDAMRNVWLMLLDLYQITGKQQQFESLSLDYAGKFETSPPAWIAARPRTGHTAPAAGATPAVSFSGKLDAGASKHIDRVQKLAESYRTLRLEFARISEVDAEGCALLLAALHRLQKSGHNLVLAGAQELTEKIRAIIEVGRRDATENAWLLLLELLRLLNREQDFEEASIDYCVTFEVSPPAFVAPENKVTMASEIAAASSKSDEFVMPAVVEGRIDNLIVAIAAYSDEHCPAIIDCSQTVRVDFNAAGRLLTGLAPFCGNGKSIEFHYVNHLVAALFDVIGLKDVIRVVPRKN